MMSAFIDALMLETLFDQWLEGITTKPTSLNSDPNYRRWAKGIFVQKLTMLMETA